MVMAKNQTYQYQNPKTGLIETIDSKSGRVVLIQRSLRDDLMQNRKDTIPWGRTGGVETRIERGLESLGIVVSKRWSYSELLVDLISQRITEGETLYEICKGKEVQAGDVIIPPYFILCKWRKEYPEFETKLQEAFKNRAEVSHGKAIYQAEMADEDNATAQKLVVDTHKWSAGVDDPDRFGTKTKVVGDINAPITFLINTGILRPGDPGFVPLEEKEAKKIEGVINGAAQEIIQEEVGERFEAVQEVQTGEESNLNQEVDIGGTHEGEIG